ncbi:MAG TPA: sodium:proton antiporter [Phycisphaerae bacterium]|nr:sodium:proton antiporter [Phycisphaerae bacterium]
MSESVLLQLAAILILGIATQWFAWRAHLPAILLLLTVGLLAGPGSAWLAHLGYLQAPLLEPDRLFGDLLLPAVSLSVALILFEGGLTLSLAEHSAASGVIWLLVTLGAAITFGFTAPAAHYLLGLHWRIAILLAAILIVTGPTVIGPLLRHVRPSGKAGLVLKWEGIIIDPVGAMIAVLVFEILSSGQLDAWPIVRTVLITLLVGTAAGLLGAGAIILSFHRHWVPDFLHNAFTLVAVLAVFAGANTLQHESGLFATIIMGLVLANQKIVNVHHVMEFKESLTILLISGLFIVLGARLQPEQLAMVPWARMALFLAVLILLARPVAVFVCTLFSSLTWAERTFIALLAPRGIVAASVASVFALRLTDEHAFSGAETLVPITFATIIGTVTIYGLTAAAVARRLGLSQPGTQGFLIAGAGPFERALAAALHAEHANVLVVDTNRAQISAARLEGLPVLYGSVLSTFVIEQTQLSPIGRFLALTPNDEVNALAVMQFQRAFSRTEVYQLPPSPRSTAREEKIGWELRGRVLFGPELTYARLEERVAAGYVIKKTPITADFSFERFKALYAGEATPLFVKTETGDILLATTDAPLKPRPGQTLFSLAPPKATPLQPTPQSTVAPAIPI